LISIAQRFCTSPATEIETMNKNFDRFDFDLRCCAPGIITSFDSAKQTVKVQLAIKDLIVINTKKGGVLQSIPIPELGDVPIVVPRAGGFSITLPIKKGDECLVVFSDSCIDSWWQNGCDTNEKNEPEAQEPLSARRHDLSDGFAILGTWSQKRVLDNYNSDALEIRSDQGDTSIEVKNDEINIREKETVVTIKDGEVMIVDGDTEVKIKDGETTITSTSVKLGGSDAIYKLIDERLIMLYNSHMHPYSEGNTGAPTVPLIAISCATENTVAK